MGDRVFWSDNGETVIVCEDGEHYCYSRGEFIEMYGEDALPDPNVRRDSGEKYYPTDIDNYYDTLVYFLNSVGSYLHFRKLGINADEGIFPVQKVVRDYGYDSPRYDIELDNRKCRYLNYLNELSDIGGKIGFSAIDDDESKKRILAFVKDRDRRRYLRDAARRAKNKCELVSINGLIRKRTELEKSRR